MARKRGTPAYGRKTQQGSYIMPREAYQKMKAAVKRTGKSESDVLTHCVMVAADNITRQMFDEMAAARKQAAAERDQALAQTA